MKCLHPLAALWDGNALLLSTQFVCHRLVPKLRQLPVKSGSTTTSHQPWPLARRVHASLPLRLCATLSKIGLIDWGALACDRYSFPNSYSQSQDDLTLLSNLGLDLRTCCYEVAFIRHNRRSLKRTPVVPLAIGTTGAYKYPMVRHP